MQKTYKILSVLLEYPQKEVYDMIPFLDNDVCCDHYLKEEELEELNLFLSECENLTLEEWQMYYVEIFDMSKRLNLYIFDHILGDSRQRGQAMVNLLEMYSKDGFELATNELPDFLPVFLEYLSFQTDEDKTIKLLNDIKKVLDKLYDLTNEQHVFYKHLFRILCSLSQRKVSIMAT